ncbi:trans-aconitate 2-methyltransferase [Bartonella tamiae]|uniref:Trans-aconitate 2-methyltransferase n=1 Tax=Bartonella tamiae Th239 TaxID=1094558 RepID=J0ZL13_9HYPH|nr:trans-aconitate 2-methyltransferase [Bartonella tamiae]EJF89083.1 hypothetical protein ME5_01634 [Bartonella tamiae Th239]EJF94667.1 hypothetical protein MEG_00248 [Bartonella tamiae Th307]
MQDWSSHLYLKFKDERTRAVRDLVQAIPLDKPQNIVDLGCGPGNSTTVLKDRWKYAVISGFDSSPNMIERAKQDLPDIDFSVQKIENWTPDHGIDLVFSNAVFQWLPDHRDQMVRLLQSMKEGSVLAAQLPDNLDEPSHRAMIEVSQESPWEDRIGKAAREKLPDVQVYYNSFSPYARHIDLWHSVYNHVMSGPEAIVEWMKGAALKSFLDPLENTEREEFLALYQEKIIKAYPRNNDGSVLLRFPRLFMVLGR